MASGKYFWQIRTVCHARPSGNHLLWPVGTAVAEGVAESGGVGYKVERDSHFPPPHEV